MPVFKKTNVKTGQAGSDLEYLQKLKATLMELKLIYERTSGLKIQKDVLEICRSTQKILQCLTECGSKIPKAKLFIDYYLPELAGILNQYVAIKAGCASSEEASRTAALIEEFVPEARRAFDRILESVAVQSSASTGAEIEILFAELKKNKLL
ncbi:MAG: hypothetical protein FWG53_11715 [Clostridiales bacterium]|nr:hypothetical protein [Clostridiales bacterium]